MSYPRPSARTSTGVLLALMLFSVIGAPSAFAAGPSNTPQVIDPGTVCSGPANMPTHWTDELHPPKTIRVLRSYGPDKGHVETVAFWKYVGVVLRTEYASGGGIKPPLWMRVGAITVKEYGWYKAMFWGAGRVTTTVDNGDGTTTSTTECYDVKDTTADQIYKPEYLDPNTGIWDLNHRVPTPANITAMRETWHMTLRKWVTDKNKSRLFLTGYRSGKANPCGADSTGFKIFQKSLRDCNDKGLTLEETLREYFEPNLLINDTSGHDMLTDSVSGESGYWGDLAVLTPSGNSTIWNLFAGHSDKFTNNVSGSFSMAQVAASGVGNVDAADATVNGNPGDTGLLADLIMVTSSHVYVAHATGTGFATTLVDTPFAGGSAARAVFGDFNGDLLTDVGLVRSTGTGTSSVDVMYATGDGHFGTPATVWSGAVDLTDTNLFVGAGDFNGDGKADLLVRDASGNLLTAVSPASCTSPQTLAIGACPTTNVGGSALGVLTALTSPPSIVGAKLTIGDYDRDGRDDVIAVKSGSTNTVYGLRGQSDGTFQDVQQLWTGPQNLAGDPVALDVNPDGMADLAIVQTGQIQWLLTNERSTAPAGMSVMSTTTDVSLTAQSRGY